MEALEADEGPEREMALGMLQKEEEIDLHFWNDEAQDPTFAPLQVQAEETGQVVYTAPE